MSSTRSRQGLWNRGDVLTKLQMRNASVERLRKLALVTTGAVLLAGAQAASQTVLFFDDCAGPALNSIWQASLPDALQPSGSLIGTYVGAPNHAFASLDGKSVLRMTNTLNPRERCGWCSSTNFTATDFRYEVRFNTLSQSAGTSIDGFIEIWILDAANPERYDIVSPFGGDYSSSRVCFAGSSIDNIYTNIPCNYRNHTWYRLVLECAPAQTVRAALLRDDGTEMAGHAFAHSASVFCSGFKIVLSQYMGLPAGPSAVDVAVDSVRLTTSGIERLPTRQPLLSPKARR